MILVGLLIWLQPLPGNARNKGKSQESTTTQARELTPAAGAAMEEIRKAIGACQCLAAQRLLQRSKALLGDPERIEYLGLVTACNEAAGGRCPDAPQDP